ncbi:MAG: hypothetical protein KC620_17580, partial [Myxococcales bacterium]|nr:hypothetical protein [Myxococcales bacterium]
MSNARFALIWVVLLTIACDDGDGSFREAGPPQPDVAMFDAEPDVPPSIDEGAEEDEGPELGELGERCERNQDCASGYCVRFGDQNVCSQTCLRGGCPEGWECRVVSNTRPDVTSVCVPPDNTLCGFCLDSEQCPNGRCFELDRRPVCGLDCETNEACPANYTCREVEADGESVRQCVPVTDSCTCNPNTDNIGEKRACAVENDFGTCFGEQACAADGWVACDAETPAEETCDGADNDCNGLIDDAAGVDMACTETVTIDGVEQACHGRTVCDLGARVVVCTAATPGPEACNSLDDDCDGAVDETFPAKGEVCIRGEGVCQRAGVQACTPDGAALACTAEVVDPGVERCNGLDDDCDGETDEGLLNLCGTCGAAPVEVCDLADNDCDGAI